MLHADVLLEIISTLAVQYSYLTFFSFAFKIFLLALCFITELLLIFRIACFLNIRLLKQFLKYQTLKICDLVNILLLFARFSPTQAFYCLRLSLVSFLEDIAFANRKW